MEPEYPVGSLIYVDRVEPSEISIGDPITFVMNESLMVATHRVVDIKEDGSFITKGDANDTVD
ncbi:signal peptidase I, partial [Escherichia coli]|uniref:signal peptidase I n=1 Tax=Escherichia coli TaxID=562 RepID=UPI0022F13B3C